MYFFNKNFFVSQLSRSKSLVSFLWTKISDDLSLIAISIRFGGGFGGCFGFRVTADRRRVLPDNVQRVHISHTALGDIQ